jgi:hypothetical protein
MPDTIYVALIGLCGVVLAGLVQWFIARYTVRYETDRLHRQLVAEFNHQQLSAWQNQFRDIIADLLEATDPEVNFPPDKKRIIPLVLRAQLMLNPDLQGHRASNALINELALKVGGWHGQPDSSVILGVHGRLLEVSRQAMYRPDTQSAMADHSSRRTHEKPGAA